MEESRIAMIAAMAANRVIGRDGTIPWDLPEDRELFKKLTMGHIVIMGRRTYEEIGGPLPGRVTYVVSSTTKAGGAGCRAASSLEGAIADARTAYRDKRIFLCGGERIYKEGLRFADEIYLSRLDEAAEGDAYFPEPGDMFRLAETRRYETFTLLIYRRRIGSKMDGRHRQ